MEKPNGSFDHISLVVPESENSLFRQNQCVRQCLRSKVYYVPGEAVKNVHF